MKLKHFGIFVGCLFAIVMAMGGCDETQQMVAPMVTENGGETMLPPMGEAMPPEGMVLIPAGSFLMGSEDEASPGSQPVHTVHVDGFFMDTHEVTNAQFKAFVDANPQWQKDNIEDRFHHGYYLHYWDGTDYPAGKAEHPVVFVSWYAAMAYAEWAGKRLPTEAEWEYAARGGLAGKKYPWGDDEPTPAHANFGNNVGDTTPVGQYPANGYGLYDMASNVSEWCLDAWDADFYAVSDDSRNPIAGGETVQELRDNFTRIPNEPGRVLRGGSWDFSAAPLHGRDRHTPITTFVFIGFRCVKDITPAPAGADVPEADEGDDGEVAEEEVPADDIADDVGIEVLEGMVLIPAGSFLMGSEDEFLWGDPQPRPVHTVHLDAFYMDIHQVTNAEFKAFVDANPEWGKDNIEDRFHDGDYLYFWTGNDYLAGRAEHPVASVSWYAAMAYAEWAGKRLPTEAEWEYAARGGLAGKKYPWGDTITAADATFARRFDGTPVTTPVGQYPANGYGLYDMAGNVWEWCLDAWDEDFYAVSDNSQNPIAGGETIQWILENFTSIPNDSYRVHRGGAWNNNSQRLRVARRNGDHPTAAYAPYGFRCVKDVTR